MDFTENIPVEVASVVATSAIDENGNDVRSLLSASDELYLIQPDIGNVVTLKFTAPQIKNARAVFLHSRGYHEYIRDYKNWPDFVALRSFKEKGAFTRYAKKQDDEFANTEDIFASALIQRMESDIMRTTSPTSIGLPAGLPLEPESSHPDVGFYRQKIISDFSRILLRS